MKKEEKDRRLKKMGLMFLALLVVVGGAILIATIKIQYVDGDFWRKKAEAREKSVRTIPARRGNIYSSDGNILASTVPVCDLYLDMGRVKKLNKNGNPEKDANGAVIMESLIPDSSFSQHIDEVCGILHEANPNYAADYFKNLIVSERAKDHGNNRCLRVLRNMPYSYWMQVCRVPGWSRAVVKKVDGNSVVHNVRAHIYGNLAGNVIGFRNSVESNSYTGLEGYYNKDLRGQDGLFLCRRLTKGTWLPVDDGSDVDLNDSLVMDSSMLLRPMIDGKHIVSTIDTRYQDIAETSLRNVLTKYGGNAGCAILMEIETGYVLACSSLSIDTATHTYREMPNRNVAVSDIYEPGSTFKTVILTAMMNDTTIDTAERVRVGQKIFSKYSGEFIDSRGHEHVDTVSIKKVIAMSSNVGMCELGWKYYRNQRNRLKESVQKIFPFETLMVDLKTSEPPSRINDVTVSDRDFLNFCYGYSTAVSALQVLTFYNAIGGEGRMVKPLFCKEVIDGKKHIPIKPVVINEQICSKKTCAIIKDLLTNVVEHGTGDNIKNSAYGIAGKTGTSVYSYKNKSRYNASFAGFFPTEKPKYSCLVVVKDISFNGRQSAVVFRDIANCVMAMDKSLGNISLEHKLKEMEDKKMSPTPSVAKGRQDDIMHIYSHLQLPYLSTDSNSYWAVYMPGVDSLHTQGKYYGYNVPEQKVPDCRGMTVKDAIELLRSAGLNVKFTGCGKVVRQTPQGNTPYAKGTTVYLELNN